MTSVSGAGIFVDFASNLLLSFLSAMIVRQILFSLANCGLSDQLSRLVRSMAVF